MWFHLVVGILTSPDVVRVALWHQQGQSRWGPGRIHKVEEGERVQRLLVTGNSFFSILDSVASIPESEG